MTRHVLGPTYPTIQRTADNLLMGLRWLGRIPDHSPKPSAEVKNEWRYTSSAPYSFLASTKKKSWKCDFWILADGDYVSKEFAASIFKVIERIVYVEDRGIGFLRYVDT
jgi:hypothetical protein